MPVRGIEILDGGEHQAGVFNFAAKLLQFIDRPEFLGIARNTPWLVFPARWLIVPRIDRAIVEIVDQVNHHMSAARLPREVVVIARQHVTIEAQSKFHRRLPMPAP